MRIRLATGPEDADVISEIAVDMWGDFSDTDVDQLIQAVNPAYWKAERIRRATQWGGQGASADVIVQLAIWALEGVFWYSFGAYLDSLRNRVGATPDGQSAESKARMHVATKYAEHAPSLVLAGESQDDAEGTRTYSFEGTLGRYEVTTRSTPAGFIYVSGTGRVPRAAVG